MFGGAPLPPRPRKKVIARAFPQLQGNLLLTVQPGHFGHLARQPDSSYKKDKLHYLQRKHELMTEEKRKQNEEITWSNFKMRFYVRTDKKWLSREIMDATAAKMMEYDLELMEKRNRLRELLAKDEREFNRETVEYFQKGKAFKTIEAKKKIEERRKQQEKEQMRSVNEKRIQQQMAKCAEVRDRFTKKQLMESKHAQLQQIRENESRRLSEKEWDKMWEHIMNKKDEEMVNREKREALEKSDKLLAQKNALNLQIKEKEMAKAEMLRQKEKDRHTMNELVETTKTEELDVLMEERRRKADTLAELKKKIAQQQKIRDDRNKAESDLEDAYNYLSRLRHEKEQQQRKISAEEYRREVERFRESTVDIERRRKLEDETFEKLLDEDRRRIERRQDDLECMKQKAKGKLLQGVLKGREEHLQYKREEAERDKEKKQTEEKAQLAAWLVENELEEVHNRQKRKENKRYLEDCQKYLVQKETKEAQTEQLLKIEGQEKMLEMTPADLRKHPLRKILENYDCYCKK